MILCRWHAHRASQWPATVEVVDSRRALGRLYVPWTGDKRLMDRGARQMRIEQVAAKLGGRAESVLPLASAFAQGEHQSPILLPAVPRKRPSTRLLLDGCHRATALYLADVDVRVALAVVQAPPDAGTLVDLALG